MGRPPVFAPFAFIAVVLGNHPARGQEPTSEWSSGGELGLESRAFRDDGNRVTEDNGLGTFGRLELRHRHGAFEEKMRGFGNGSHSTFLVEGEAIVGVTEDVRRSLTPFQRDIFAGWRFARNDEASRELVMATIADLERRGEYLVSAGYRQRLGDTWTVTAGLRLFQGPSGPAARGAGSRDSAQRRPCTARDHETLLATRLGEIPGRARIETLQAAS